MNIKFCSFSASTSEVGYDDIEKRSQIICEQVNKIWPHIQTLAYVSKDLIDDDEFWSRHSEFVMNNIRWGYYIWKPYIIKKTLEKLNDDDILIYADAGCTINANGEQRLNEYCEMLKNNDFGVLAFDLGYPEIEWSKKRVLDFFNADKFSTQLAATCIMFKKTKYSVELVDKWYEIASNYDLINNDLNTEYPEFRCHRHDQSIFSLLVKQYKKLNFNPIILKDETYWHPNWYTDGINYPFWATRTRR
jgi:hypothetical protein